jgi:hypothetical protein
LKISPFFFSVRTAIYLRSLRYLRTTYRLGLPKRAESAEIPVPNSLPHAGRLVSAKFLARTGCYPASRRGPSGKPCIVLKLMVMRYNPKHISYRHFARGKMVMSEKQAFPSCWCNIGKISCAERHHASDGRVWKGPRPFDARRLSGHGTAAMVSGWSFPFQLWCPILKAPRMSNKREEQRSHDDPAYRRRQEHRNTQTFHHQRSVALFGPRHQRITNRVMGHVCSRPLC